MIAAEMTVTPHDLTALEWIALKLMKIEQKKLDEDRSAARKNMDAIPD